MKNYPVQIKKLGLQQEALDVAAGLLSCSLSLAMAIEIAAIGLVDVALPLCLLVISITVTVCVSTHITVIGNYRYMPTWHFLAISLELHHREGEKLQPCATVNCNNIKLNPNNTVIVFKSVKSVLIS